MIQDWICGISPFFCSLEDKLKEKIEKKINEKKA